MPGKIGWIDLTVDNAEETRDFYQAVADWESSGVDMGDYEDFCVMPKGTEDAIAGICHRRGPNESMPGGWLIYIVVDDLEQSRAKCLEMGGKIIVETRDLGPGGKFCVIEDPSGAHAALFQSN